MNLPRTLRRFALLLPLLALAQIAHAQSLYTGSVPINSQSDAERGEALKSALAQVVVKLSGGDNAVLEALVAGPDIVRIAPVALYTRFEDTHHFVTVLEELCHGH